MWIKKVRMKELIKVGLCGLGTVGSGVYQLIKENFEIIQNRTGLDIRIVKAATIDKYDNLGLDLSKIEITDDVENILKDPEIDIVVELIGGTTLAKKIVMESLQNGKSVVTANKALLAKCSKEIFHSAYQSKGFLGFEASVAGGIPIIRSIKEGFSGDKIEKISGIVNGTANYILSSMTQDRIDFNVALKNAQELGYAEADPTFDIEGIDAAHKVIILMELAFNVLFKFDQLYIEGITGIETIDIDIADKAGYVIKLLGKMCQTEKGYEGRVHPALLKKENMLASVQGAFNAVSVYGNFVGHTMSYGAGAGSHPTASAVVGDIVEISRYIAESQDKLVYPLTVSADRLDEKEMLPISGINSSYYLRFNTDKSDDAIKGIINDMADHNIAISSFTQKKGESSNHLIVFTEEVLEKEMQASLNRINSLPFILEPTKLIRIEPE